MKVGSQAFLCTAKMGQSLRCHSGGDTLMIQQVEMKKGEGNKSRLNAGVLRWRGSVMIHRRHRQTYQTHSAPG